MLQGMLPALLMQEAVFVCSLAVSMLLIWLAGSIIPVQHQVALHFGKHSAGKTSLI